MLRRFRRREAPRGPGRPDRRSKVEAAPADRALDRATKRRRGALRLDESKSEFVGWNLRLQRSLFARIGGIAQEVAFSFEHETHLSHFREDDRFVDAMQAFPDRDVSARLGGVIYYNEMAA